MRRLPSQVVDVAMYFQALPKLLRHLSVFAAPLLGAVVALLLDQLGQTMTNPLGGFGAGIYNLLAQLCWMFAFGVAVIQASNIWRDRDGSLSAAWDDARRKAGGILMAAVGFTFVIFAASLVGQMLGTVGIVLPLLAAVFLIYTIPAAAIGGMPGQLALSASIRGVRNQPVASLILALVFVALWILATGYGAQLLLPYVSQRLIPLIVALFQALVLGYLAFPFAKQYDEVAFRGYY